MKLKSFFKFALFCLARRCLPAGLCGVSPQSSPHVLFHSFRDAVSIADKKEDGSMYILFVCVLKDTNTDHELWSTTMSDCVRVDLRQRWMRIGIDSCVSREALHVPYTRRMSR